MGDRDSRQLRRSHPDLVQRSEENRYRGLAPGLDQHRRRSLNEVAGRHPLPPAEHGVDLEDAGGDGPWRGHGRNGIATPGVVDVQARIGVAVRPAPV